MNNLISKSKSIQVCILGFGYIACNTFIYRCFCSESLWEFEQCPTRWTRWTIRTGAMQVIITKYRTLEMTMEEASHGTDDCPRCASGVSALMEKFST